MPYIKKIRRPQYDVFLAPLVARLVAETKGGQEHTGDVTYCIYVILKRVFGTADSYDVIANALKVLVSTEHEYVEHVLKPFEQAKRELHGDV